VRVPHRTAKGGPGITCLQAQTVFARQQGIREHLAEELAVKRDYLTRFLRPGGQLGPLSQADIDIVTVLPRSFRARGLPTCSTWSSAGWSRSTSPRRSAGTGKRSPSPSPTPWST
jgi:hypothetical protein